MFGQMQQRAVIIRFSKRDMEVKWQLVIKDSSGADAPASEMNEIYSFVQPENGDYMYACGYKWEDPTLETYKKAVTLKVDTNG